MLVLQTCKECGQEKPLTSEYWYRTRNKKSGFAGKCKDCLKVSNALWHAANKPRRNAQALARFRANPEKYKAMQRLYENANKDKLKAYRETHAERRKALHKAWRESNKEYVAYTKRLWKEDNRDKVRAKKHKRRALGAGMYNIADLIELYREQNECCKYCLVRFSDDTPFTVDHVLPLAKGGTNEPSNLALACGSCNSSKRDRLLGTEWTPPKDKRAV